MDLFDSCADHNGSVSSPVEAAQGYSSPLVTFDQVFRHFIFVEFQLAPFGCFTFTGTSRVLLVLFTCALFPMRTWPYCSAGFYLHKRYITSDDTVMFLCVYFIFMKISIPNFVSDRFSSIHFQVVDYLNSGILDSYLAQAGFRKFLFMRIILFWHFIDSVFDLLLFRQILNCEAWSYSPGCTFLFHKVRITLCSFEPQISHSKGWTKFGQT
jgi:hypothetical protein